MRNDTIPEKILKTSEVRETQPAIISETGQELTFSQLATQIEETVSSLNEFGVCRGDRVAIVLPQSPELAVAFLSVASGATAAPLNHNYKEDDFRFFLDDIEARALVVQSGDKNPAIEAARALNIPVIDLVPDASGNGAFSLRGTQRAITAEGGFADKKDTALILHTSGTTSKPKMVPLSHANLCVSADNIIQTLMLKPEDTCLNVMPLFHIHGLVACVLASLMSGGRTICTSEFNSERFSNWLTKFNPSWYSAVPTMHQAILGQSKGVELNESSLRFIRSSSAALPPPVMIGLEELFKVPVVESYGMTEAAHQMASNPLPPLQRKPGSVGIAAGPEIGILNDSNQKLPQGEVGEISIRGENVTLGYENNPQSNKDAFTQGWFRTGDQGYLDEDGYLFLTGRLKEMINRGGENIAPREIDEALLNHSQVLQAVCFAIPHDTLGEDVAAAVILETDSTVDDADLRIFAMEKLPDFKVPSRILILNDIPKGPTGKLQRIGLAEKLKDHLVTSYLAPKGETEKTICKLMEEVLDVARVGRNDNFFFLGGDSLKATRILNRLKEDLSIDLPGALLFQFPEPKSLAKRLDEIVIDFEVESLSQAIEGLSDEEKKELLS